MFALGLTLHLPCGHAQPPHRFGGLCGPVQENPAANPWLGSATSLPAPRNGFSPALQYHLIRGRWVLQARQQCSMYDLGPPSPDIFQKSYPLPTPASGVAVQVFSLESKQLMPGMAHNTWMNGEPFLGYPSNSFHALRPTIKTDTSIQTGVTSGLPECLWPDVVRNNRPLGSHHADAWPTFWALGLFRSNKDLMTVNIGSGVIVYIFMFYPPWIGSHIFCCFDNAHIEYVPNRGQNIRKCH